MSRQSTTHVLVLVMVIQICNRLQKIFLGSSEVNSVHHLLAPYNFKARSETILEMYIC